MDFLLSFKLPNILLRISKELHAHDAKAIVVGGSVRDYYLHLPIKDYDIEVYGLDSLERLENILLKYGSVNLVGKSFGIVKLKVAQQEYDFSFPRRESKIGLTHKDFEVEVDGMMEYHEAARRRDFTINAMGYDIQNNIFLDPFHGLEDLKKKKLQHIDDKTFSEDPLRIYRAVQFCARFSFSLADKTFLLCQNMVKKGALNHLPKERVYEEFKKLLLKSPKPSVGFSLMRALGILHYFPELEAIIGMKQSLKWYLEDDVWVHTMKSIDAMVSLLCDDEKTNLIFMFAILSHDFAIEHEHASVTLSERFLHRLTDEVALIKRVLPLVQYHRKPSQFYSAQSKDNAIRKLAIEVNIEELITVAKACFLASGTHGAKEGVYRAGEWLQKRAKSLNVSTKPLENLLKGSDLIALGLEPSPHFKKILDAVYLLQIEGTLVSKKDALVYVKSEFMVLE